MKKICLLTGLMLLGMGVLKAQNATVNRFGEIPEGVEMEASMGDLILNGNKLDDNDIKALFGECGYETYNSANRLRRGGLPLIIVGGVMSAVGGVINITLTGRVAESLTNPNNTSFKENLSNYFRGETISTVLVAAGTVFLSVGICKRKMGKVQLECMANDFNSFNKMREKKSLVLSPTLINVPNESGAWNGGYGAGLTFNF